MFMNMFCDLHIEIDVRFGLLTFHLVHHFMGLTLNVNGINKAHLNFSRAKNSRIIYFLVNLVLIDSILHNLRWWHWNTVVVFLPQFVGFTETFKVSSLPSSFVELKSRALTSQRVAYPCRVVEQCSSAEIQKIFTTVSIVWLLIIFQSKITIAWTTFKSNAVMHIAKYFDRWIFIPTNSC